MDSYLDMQHKLTVNNDQSAVESCDHVSVTGTSVCSIATSGMKIMVRKWSEIDAEIKRSALRNRRLRLEKAELEQKIIEFMNQNELDGLNTKDALIQYKTCTRKVRAPKKVIHDEIDKVVVDEQARLKIKELLDNPPKEAGKEKVTLKRLVF